MEGYIDKKSPKAVMGRHGKNTTTYKDTGKYKYKGKISPLDADAATYTMDNVHYSCVHLCVRCLFGLMQPGKNVISYYCY